MITIIALMPFAPTQAQAEEAAAQNAAAQIQDQIQDLCRSKALFKSGKTKRKVKTYTADSFDDLNINMEVTSQSQLKLPDQIDIPITINLAEKLGIIDTMPEIYGDLEMDVNFGKASVKKDGTIVLGEQDITQNVRQFCHTLSADPLKPTMDALKQMQDGTTEEKGQ